MVDMEKVKTLTSLLEERSGLNIREALIRHYDYMADHEAVNFDSELEFLLIISRIDTLERLVKRAMDRQDKADLTIYDLRKRGNEVIAERDDAREKLKAVRSEKSQLSSELQTVKAESRLYSEVYDMLERIATDVLRQAKEMVQAKKLAKQQRQAEYQSTTKRKKSWGLE